MKLSIRRWAAGSAFLAFCAIGASAILAAGPTVVTDKQDYSPGQTAYIAGSGFHPNETITLRVVHTNGVAEPGNGHEPFTVTTDANGEFHSQWYVDPDDSAGATFKVTATCGEGLFAEYEFTDSALANLVVQSGQSPVSIQPGQSATYVLRLSKTPAGGGNSDISGNWSFTGLPAGASASISPLTWSFTGNGNETKDYTVTVTTNNSGPPATRTPSGNHIFTVKATNSVAPADTKQVAVTLVVDATPPISSVSLSGTMGDNNWYRSSVTANISATDNVGVTGRFYILDGGAPQSGSSVVVSGQGSHTLEYWSTDAAGNPETHKTTSFKIDSVAPTISKGATNGTDGDNGWYTSNVSVNYTASDADPGSGIVTGDESFVLSTSGEGASVSLPSRIVKDLAGNTATVTPLTFKVDKTAPVISGADVADATWRNTDFVRSFTVTDAVSGVVAGDASFTLTASDESGSENSPTTTTRTVKDQAGNTATRSISALIDKTKPVLDRGTATGDLHDTGWYWTKVDVPFTATDGLSGLANAGDASFTVSTSGEGATAPLGTKEIKDRAGNVASTADIDGDKTFKVDLNDPTIQPVPSRQPNSKGWYTAPFQVSWTVGDGSGSGVPEVPAKKWESGDTDSGVLSETVTDAAGRTSQPAEYAFKYDATKPLVNITGIVEGAIVNAAEVNLKVEDSFLDTWALNGDVQTSTEVTRVFNTDGTHTVTAVAKDKAGNEESKSVTFRVYSKAPVISSTLEEKFYNAAFNLNYSVTSDIDVSFTLQQLAKSLATGDSLVTATSGMLVTEEGNYVLTLKAKDAAGNPAQVQYKYGLDLTKPKAEFEFTGTEGKNGWYVGSMLSALLKASDPKVRPDLDGSGVDSIAYKVGDADLVSGLNTSTETLNELSEGVYDIVFRVLDKAGNEKEETKTVKYDRTTPVIGALGNVGPIEATGPNGAVANLSTPSSLTDNLSKADQIVGKYLVEANPVASGDTFPLGKTTVTYIAADDAGNEAKKCFTVEVKDTTAPTLPDMADLTFEATDKDGAVVSFTLPSATDLVDQDVAVSADVVSGAKLALGDHTVTVTAKDDAGNETTKLFTIHVKDTIAPEIGDLPSPKVEATSNAGAVVSFSVGATDAVDENPSVTYSKNPGTTFPVGTTTVTVTAKDASGNKSTKSFDVEVQDTTAPAVTTPGSITLEATGPGGAVATFATSATDIVDGSVPTTNSPVSGSTFPLGTTTVNVSAKDAAGNVGKGSFSVTVQDTTAPVISVPSTINVFATSGAGAVVNFAISATDLVSGAVMPSPSKASGNVFAPGTTTVVVTAKDAAGNTSTKSFNVVVRFKDSGFLQPINADGSSVFKFGSTIPVKVKISPTVTDAVIRLYYAKVSNSVVGSDVEAVSTSAADTGNQLRYDATADQYIFNLNTKALEAGTWQLKLDFGDGVLRTVNISLKK
ncbi:HYR domain-containing protein [bacterium]|nr:MAG: HYR domain-containing protein [bacterium]